jgi:hypothetical protein
MSDDSQPVGRLAVLHNRPPTTTTIRQPPSSTFSSVWRASSRRLSSKRARMGAGKGLDRIMGPKGFRRWTEWGSWSRVRAPSGVRHPLQPPYTALPGGRRFRPMDEVVSGYLDARTPSPRSSTGHPNGSRSAAAARRASRALSPRSARLHPRLLTCTTTRWPARSTTHPQRRDAEAALRSSYCGSPTEADQDSDERRRSGGLPVAYPDISAALQRTRDDYGPSAGSDC